MRAEKSFCIFTTKKKQQNIQVFFKDKWRQILSSSLRTKGDKYFQVIIKDPRETDTFKVFFKDPGRQILSNLL